MKKIFAAICFIIPAIEVMAYSGPASAESSLLRMILGLILVLAVFAGLAWAVKRMVPKIAGNNMLIEVKGGVSVGSRERVVVLQVADRLIVVGVAPGRVTAIANLDAHQAQESSVMIDESKVNAVNTENQDQVAVEKQSFAQWLKNAASNF